MPDANAPVLAVYDFRSKQEFIYRTNYMRQITGASELIAGIYREFLQETDVGKLILDDWRKLDKAVKLIGDDGLLRLDVIPKGKRGAVVYEGGGNLVVIYENRDFFVQANKAFSRRVVEKAYSLSMIVGSCIWDDELGFDGNRSEAYKSLDRAKRLGNMDAPCNVLPFAQVDTVTYQPIVESRKIGSDRMELSREACCKLDAWKAKGDTKPDWKREGRFIDALGTEKGTDSLIAVMYFDGNSIGEKVKEATEGADDKLLAMRRFSIDLHKELVEAPEERMRAAIEGLQDERQRSCRVIVDHGDEITFICNAHAAPLALNAYLEAVAGSAHNHHACGGVVFCHSHDPFAEVYRLAEECCESGKERNRLEQRLGGSDASYVDIHFARSGITGSLEQIREAQETDSLRPYRADEYDLLLYVGRRLRRPGCRIRRSDLKALNRAMQRGESWYQIELMRLRAKDPSALSDIEGEIAKRLSEGDLWRGERTAGEVLRLLLLDVSGLWDVFDLCFAQSENGGAR